MKIKKFKIKLVNEDKIDDIKKEFAHSLVSAYEIAANKYLEQGMSLGITLQGLSVLGANVIVNSIKAGMDNYDYDKDLEHIEALVKLAKSLRILTTMTVNNLKRQYEDDKD
jgi:hypothetical protein